MLIFAQELPGAGQILAILIVVSLIVIGICVFGFLAFVRWGQGDTKKNRARDIELAQIMKEKEKEGEPD